MSDYDDTEKLRVVQERVSKLKDQIAEARGQLYGMHQGIEALSRLDPRHENAAVMKQVIGMTRDVGLKMLEMGSAMRRLADLVEPMVDEMIKEDGP